MADLITRCPHCGQKVRVGDEGLYRCPSCRNTFRFRLDAEPPVEPSPPQPPQPPAPMCERCNQRVASLLCRDCGQFLCAECAVTGAQGEVHCAEHAIEAHPGRILRGMLRHPADTFGAMSPSGRFFLTAFLTGAIAGVAAVVITSLYELVLPSPMTLLTQKLVHDFIPSLPMDTSANTLGVIMAIVMSPFSAVAALFFTALVLHVCHLIVGSGKSGLVATIKVVCYAEVAAVLNVLPYIGQVMFFVVQFVLLVIGGAKLHRVTYARSTIALLLPLVVITLLITVAILLIGAFFGQILPSPGGKLI